MPQSAALPVQQKNLFWRVFALCFAMAAVLYLPYVIVDGGLFHYAGDFNGQQINFYQYANAFVKNGGGSFSWETDLGGGFINSYSFYFVGSPFWWLSLLIPARAMPYCMIPMLCLKFSLAGGGSYLWMRRYTKDGQWAVLGAALYAFSGFTVYNVFFNHFVDVIAIFPFLLWALDATVLDGRRGVFVPLVALSLVNNYFFFAGQIVFLLIYFVCKCLSGDYKLSGKLFSTLAFESLAGCGLGCVLAWPAVLSLMQNPRTVDLSSGYGFLLYGKVQQYFAILFSFFLMPDVPYQLNLFNEGIIKWTSLTAYLPMVSCAGVITWLRFRPRTAFKRILCTCLVCAFVPVLNSAFYMLNSSYYARWYYMPILIMCACTACGLEQKLDQTDGVRTAAIVAACSMAFALVPVKNEDGGWGIGVISDQPKFWSILLVTILGLAVFWFLLLKFRSLPKLSRALLAGVLVCTLIYGNLHIAYTKFCQWDNDKNFVQQCYTEGPILGAALPDDHFYRTDAYECYENMSLWTGKPNLQFFNSTVAPRILSFYPEVGVKRDVSSKPEQSNYALRGLLSVQYLFVPLDEEDKWIKENVKGWNRSFASGSYAVYENENFLPMGFAYEYYVTQEQLEGVPAASRSNVLMKALMLSEEQIEAYGKLLAPLPAKEISSRGYDDYVADCAARRAVACDSFTAQKNGFSATITLEEENLVFFSVPYDDGFTATVNGQPVVVEEVDSGLMAVAAPAGKNSIEFTYHTPGLAASCLVAGGCALLYLGYLVVLLCGRSKKRPASPPSNDPDAFPPIAQQKPCSRAEMMALQAEERTAAHRKSLRDRKEAMIVKMQQQPTEQPRLPEGVLPAQNQLIPEELAEMPEMAQQKNGDVRYRMGIAEKAGCEKPEEYPAQQNQNGEE